VSRRWRLLTAGVALWVAASPEAAAQGGSDAPSLRAHHVTVSGGIVWTGGYGIGSSTAELRGNGLGTSAPPFVLFQSDSSVDTVVGVDGRVGFALTPNLTIEGGMSFQRPGLTTELSADAEASPVTLDAERVAQYLFDAALTWQIPGTRIGSRIRPFVIAGGGYLRQLYDERTLVETGSVYYGGAGIRYWLRGGDGLARSIGLRADGRAMWRLNGVDFEDRTRVAPMGTLHLFVEF
jgi:hypothetical protein